MYLFINLCALNICLSLHCVHFPLMYSVRLHYTLFGVYLCFVNGEWSNHWCTCKWWWSGKVHWCTCKFCWWRSTLMYRQVVGEEVHQCPCKFCWQRIKLMYMQAVMKKYTDVQASCGEEAHWCTCGLWWRNRTSFLSWVCVPKADVTRFRVKLGRTDVNKNSFFPRTVRD